MSLRQFSRISRMPLIIRNFSSSVDCNSLISPTNSVIENEIQALKNQHSAVNAQVIKLENKISNMEAFHSKKTHIDDKSKDHSYFLLGCLLIGGIGIGTLGYSLIEQQDLEKSTINLKNRISKIEESKKTQTEIEYDIAVNNFINGIAIGALIYTLFGK